MPFDIRETFITLIFILLTILIALCIYYLINIGNTKVSLKNRLKLDQVYIKRVSISLIILLFILFLFTKKIIRATMITILISLVVSYLINPLVNRFEKNKLQRSYSILLVYFLIISIFSIIIIILVPKLSVQLKTLIYSLPSFFDNLINSIYKFLNENFEGNSTVQRIMSELKNALTTSILKIQEFLLTSMTNFGKRVSDIAGIFIRLVLIPIFSFYFLKDKEKYINKFKTLIPEKKRDKTLEVLKDIDIVNSQFVRGRLLMALAVGLLTAIFLLIMQVDYAIIIGLITIVADIIPYIGPLFGFIPAVLISFFDSPIKALIVSVAFIFIQWLENNVLGPKILGNTIGINPLLVLLSLIIGGGLFGVAGMIFSVPVVATFKVLIKHYKKDLIDFFIKEEKE